MIGQMNQQATFKVYSLATSASGEQERTLETSYTEFVKSEELNSSRSLEQSGLSFSKAFRITKRHFNSRPIDTALTEIIYRGFTLSVHNVKSLNEGREFFDEILCYTNAQ